MSGLLSPYKPPGSRQGPCKGLSRSAGPYPNNLTIRTPEFRFHKGQNTGHRHIRLRQGLILNNRRRMRQKATPSRRDKAVPQKHQDILLPVYFRLFLLKQLQNGLPFLWMIPDRQFQATNYPQLYYTLHSRRRR